MKNKLLFFIFLFVSQYSLIAQIITDTHISIVEEETKTLEIVFKMNETLATNKYIYCKSIPFTAQDDTDYLGIHHIVTIHKGNLQDTLKIPLIQNDTCEGLESFFINWSEDIVEDPDFNKVSKYWTPLKNKGGGKHGFEVNKAFVYGSREDRNNLVVEVDQISQGYQKVEVIKGVKHRVSFLASRRLGAMPASATVDLLIKVIDPATRKVQASTLVQRSNTTFKFTEEEFYFTPTTDEVELVFSTETNKSSTGMILDKLSIVPVFNDEKKAEDILSTNIGNFFKHGLSYGVIKVDIKDCEKVVQEKESLPKVETLRLYFDNDDYHIIHGETSIAEKNKEIVEKAIFLLKKHEQVNVKITAYASCRGTEAYNKALSLKRAEETKLYLIQKGIPKERIIELTSLGEIQATDCDCEKSCNSKQLSENRRVEIDFDAP